MVYPDVYCNSKQCGFDLKSEFQIKLKEQKDKKTSQHLGNDPSVYKNREEFLTLNKKSVNTADLTAEGERKIDEKIEKRKKNRELAGKKKKKN